MSVLQKGNKKLIISISDSMCKIVISSNKNVNRPDFSFFNL